MTRKRDRFAYQSPPTDQPWCWFSRDMLESPAWSAMPLAARKVVERILLEHMAHAGTQNGELTVTYSDFVRFGVRRNSIRRAIEVAVALGFIDITLQGVASYGTRRQSSQYALTWLGRRDRTPPSDRWRRITEERAAEIIGLRRNGSKGGPAGDI